MIASLSRKSSDIPVTLVKRYGMEGRGSQGGHQLGCCALYVVHEFVFI